MNGQVRTVAPRRSEFQFGNVVTKWTVLVVALLIAVLMIAPLYLVVINAFKTGTDYSINGPLALPEQWTLSAFGRYLGTVPFWRLLWNSVLISTLVAILGTLLSLVTSYAIGIGRVRGRMTVVFILLIATMLPQEALLYPLFYGAQATGLHNSVWSVVIIFTVLQAAFGTYLLSSAMSSFPREVLEAAMVDGATPRQQFFQITVPLLKPILQFTMVTSAIGGLQMYDIPQLFNEGKPLVNVAGTTVESTRTIVMLIKSYINAGPSQN